jgi:hypothetical protein
MTSQEAKEALLLFRPGLDDEADPDFAPALACLRDDPELKNWFDQHRAMQKTVFAGFDGLAVPEGLKEQILSERPRPMLPVRRTKRMALVFAAVPLVALLALGVVYLRSPAAADFPTYRQAMVSKAPERYPKMDLYTNDLAEIRQYIGAHGGHRDYALPASLEKLAGTGCKIFDWRGKRVSMVCFNSGKGGPGAPDLFLFIVDRSAVQEPSTHCPGPGPAVADVKSLATVSWIDGGKTYLLAGTGDQEFLKRFY